MSSQIKREKGRVLAPGWGLGHADGFISSPDILRLVEGNRRDCSLMRPWQADANLSWG